VFRFDEIELAPASLHEVLELRTLVEGRGLVGVQLLALHLLVRQTAAFFLVRRLVERRIHLLLRLVDQVIRHLARVLRLHQVAAVRLGAYCSLLKQQLLVVVLQVVQDLLLLESQRDGRALGGVLLLGLAEALLLGFLAETGSGSGCRRVLYQNIYGCLLLEVGVDHARRLLHGRVVLALHVSSVAQLDIGLQAVGGLEHEGWRVDVQVGGSFTLHALDLVDGLLSRGVLLGVFDFSTEVEMGRRRVEAPTVVGNLPLLPFLASAAIVHLHLLLLDLELVQILRLLIDLGVWTRRHRLNG